ncbi:MAG: hypothetical protein LBR31_01315 [Desulfovibrio sp.]|jgi:hypothetical protein|nr:hypothetical protein [Desulfovibrio sp.]
MISAEEAGDFIIRCIRAERGEQKDCPPLTGQSPLLGRDAVLTSLELVRLLLLLEDWCAEKGASFNWTSDAAMSGNRSAWRTVESLARHLALAQKDGRKDER